ncbi:MAG: ABC transporter permease [Candidatus Margulisiibacteriota bacterium]|jgi:peptide/nickel transport system permease protein
MMSIKGKIAIVFLFLLIVSASFVSFLPLDPNNFDPHALGEPLAPSLQHLFGTDDLGRDVLLRSIYGARISLLVGFVSVGFALTIGIIIGVCSGFIGGVVDEIIMRLVDLIMALPTIFLILIIQSMTKPNIMNVIIVIGCTSWMGVARLVRAEVLSIKNRGFVIALRARSLKESKILIKHILPHALTPIIVAGVLGIGGAILTESTLSFLGLGVQPPFASWGNMLENSMNFMFDAPWLAIAPGLLITGTVLSLNFLGDDLRGKFNPK